jgi:hypothetical protein
MWSIRGSPESHGAALSVMNAHLVARCGRIWVLEVHVGVFEAHLESWKLNLEMRKLTLKMWRLTQKS